MATYKGHPLLGTDGKIASSFFPSDVGLKQFQISGNTSNTSNIVVGSLVLAGGDNITLSQVSGASIATITISASVPTATIVGSVASANSVGTSPRYALEDHKHAGIYKVSIGGNTSGDVTAGAGSLAIAGGPNITLSGSTVGGGMTISVSAPAPTGVASATTVTPVSAANSVGTITRYAAEDHAHAGVFSMGVSTGGNTSGSTAVIPGQFVLKGGNNITLSQSTSAGSLVTIEFSAANETQTVPPIGTSVKAVASASSVGTITRFAPEDHAHPGIAMFAAGSSVGNTAGNTASTIGNVILAGSGNVTISGSTGTGGNITAWVQGPVIGTSVNPVSSASNIGTVNRWAPEDHAHAGVFSLGVSTDGNTGGNTRVVPGQFIIAGSNAISASQVTTTGNLNTIHIQGPRSASTVSGVQSYNSVGTRGTVFALEDHIHQGLAQFQISGNTSNTSNIVVGSLVLAGGNNVTLSQVSAAGAATISISAQTAAPIATAVNSVGSANSVGTVTRFAPEDHKHEGLYKISVGGNTAGNTSAGGGSFALAGGPNVTLSGSTNTGGALTLSVSVAAPGGVIATTVNSVGSANSVGTVTRFAPEDHQHEGVFKIGVSTAGNTAGNTTVRAGQFVFQGSNALTLSQGTGAAGVNTIYIQGPLSATTISGVASANAIGTRGSRFALEDHQHEGVFSMGVSNIGNTSGSTVVYPGRFVLKGGNNVTLSQSTVAGNLATIEFSVPNTNSQTVQTQNCVDATLAGNTTGTLALISSGTMTLAGGNNITLSQNQNAVTISAGGGTLSQFGPFGSNNMIFTNDENNGVRLLYPFDIKEFVTASRLDQLFKVSISSSSNSSHAGSLTLGVAIYTKNNSSFSLASSSTQTYAWTNTSNNSMDNLSGIRVFSIPINMSLTPGNYFMALVSSSNTANANWASFSRVAISMHSGQNFYHGIFLNNSTDAQSSPFIVGLGELGGTATTFANSINTSSPNINNLVHSHFPFVVMRNI